DGCRRGRADQRPDRGDFVADDADVAAKPRAAGAIDDAAAGDEDVESRRRPLRRSERGAGESENDNGGSEAAWHAANPSRGSGSLTCNCCYTYSVLSVTWRYRRGLAAAR